MDKEHDDKTRVVFRFWPRDPKGQVLRPSARRGKETSNGVDLWGATPYDFYRVRRVPDCLSYVTTSTGSKLASAMRELGELDAAADEIAWADQEEDPRQVFPCDIGEVISDQDYRIQMGFFDDQSMRREEEQPPSQTADKSPEFASTSAFDPSNYPYPWPLVPFSVPIPSLQKRIPIHVLPQKLIVHDPWNLLSVDDAHEDSDSKWTDKKDVVRIYSLHLSDDAKKTIEKEKKDREKQEAEANEKEEYYTFLPEVKESGLTEHPAVLVVPPPRPPAPEVTTEAHLYLSPTQLSGKGNRSVVYNAEWELPRSLMVADKLCEACIADVVSTEMHERKKHGDPPASEKAPDTKQRISATVVVEADRDDLGESSTMAPSQKQVGAVIITDHSHPGMSVEVIPYKNEPFTPGSQVRVNSVVEQEEAKPDSSADGSDGRESKGKGKENEKDPDNIYTIQKPSVVRTASYEGPFVKIRPNIQWQNPSRAPLAKVRVAAKLSIQGDTHLAREVENYQAFPTHFFEHWNGYNVIPPLHDPVPVSAVVPQFYGYYIPDPPPQEHKERVDQLFLSPIMLLEHCGVPIEVESLRIDDRQECAALLYRFHHAGWTHGSFAPRNILMQHGPLTGWPLIRMASNVLSFRLIDFGRSHKTDVSSRGSEECDAHDTLRLDQFG